ncbi:DUF2489 domain-containing protein [Aeromonas enteropelogenes]|uniref:DUF2489 domain-containing protein n=1 Tax=Aeromonas enteropelogenes TaxID=29489 RepID=A0ABU9JDY3_AEREN|nr:DUF2489 domain-containing protein [Aeromonas enteropelogenes]MBL0458722.1 DUF2489 domain-containing protein [Aeromonas enteropelogenes]
MLAALLGGLILSGLAIYAGMLLARLKRQQERQLQAILARNERILDSVRVIAHAVLEGQCDYSEGAIRLTNLLDALQIKEGRAFAAEFPGLYGLYEKVKEMPTHEARRALKRNEVMKLDLERSGYEAELESQILKDAAQLKDLQLSQ